MNITDIPLVIAMVLLKVFVAHWFLGTLALIGISVMAWKLSAFFLVAAVDAIRDTDIRQVGKAAADLAIVTGQWILILGVAALVAHLVT